MCKVYGRIAPLVKSAQCYNSAKVGGCSCPGRRMLDPKAGFTILLPPIKSHRHHYSLTHYSDRIRSFTKSPERRSYRFQSLSYQWFERRNTLVTDIFDIYLTCCPKVDKQIGTILQVHPRVNLYHDRNLLKCEECADKFESGGKLFNANALGSWKNLF